MNIASAALLALGLSLFGCARHAAPRFDDVLFERHAVVTDATKHQTVVPGSFLPGPSAQLAAVYVEATGERRVRLIGFDGNAWVEILDAALPTDVLFVDVANIGGRDRLIAYTRHGVIGFDPDAADAARSKTIATLGSNFKVTAEGGIPRIDITRDVNGDGLDDLVMPDFDGFWIATQSSDGSFDDAVKLGPAEPFLDATAFDDTQTYRHTGITTQTIPWYLSRVHQLDADQDGRSDLLFWNGDHFEVHRQTPRGRFDPVPEHFTTDVSFDFDGDYGLIFQLGDRSTFSLLLGLGENLRHTMLHAFRDMNGDGIADLVTMALQGRSVVRLRSQYEVHFGTPTTDGIDFTPDVSTVIPAPGKNPGLQASGYSSSELLDFDGDGRRDIMMQAVNTGISGIFSAIVGNAVEIELAFYRFNDGGYPTQPDATRIVTPAFAPLDKRGVFFPTVLIGDVDGDSRADLLVGKDRGELHVFPGVAGPTLFAPQPRRVAAPMPVDYGHAWLADLNKDGKQDVVIHHPSATEPHRLTMLITR